MEQTTDGKHVRGRRHLDRRDQKQGCPELEEGRPPMMEDKMHLVVEECGPEEGEQRLE